MKCIVCGKEFESKRESAKYCSSGCRLKHHRETLTDKNETLSKISETLTETLSESDNGGKKIKYLSDLGVDLKELGVRSCGPGEPIVLVDMPTIDQIQSLCKVIHALKGDMEWEPRCGMGNSF